MAGAERPNRGDERRRASVTDPAAQPRLLGLAGTIASGKSTVASALAARGADVIDGDEVYRALVGPGSPLIARLASRFGPQIVTADGRLNRRALGEIVFQDAAALADLDALTHPAVVAETRRQIGQSTAPVVVIEAVKLAQTDLVEDLDALWVVTADPDVRLSRLMARSGLDARSARARLDAFPDPVPAGTQVDAVIDNSGDLAALERQIDVAWDAFLAKHLLVASTARHSPEEGS